MNTVIFQFFFIHEHYVAYNRNYFQVAHLYNSFLHFFFSYCPPDNILETEKRYIKRNKY